MKDLLEKIKNVSNSELDAINTNYMNMYNVFHGAGYFHLPSGKEHYRLLIYISTLLNKEIIYDVGTYRCMSSIALSYNYSNKVRSFDIVKSLPMNPIIPNVSYFLQDVTTDKKLIDSKLIFLDVAHDGTFEDIFYSHLNDIRWKGLLVLDDIHLNEPMKNFWNSIKQEKYDITNIGHWSGTGIVYFA